MSEQFVFTPGRRLGIVFHLGAILVLLIVGVLGLYQAASAGIGPAFLLYLSLPLLTVLVAPLLAYRLYALWTAYYVLERDGIRLRWGLRQENIPMTNVTWVSPASELEKQPPLPLLRWPGAVLGMRHLTNKQNLTGSGPIEYMASSGRGLVLVGTRERVFAISPADLNGFSYTFDRLTELGSLTPLQARSVYPTFLIARAWRSRLVRGLLLSSWLLTLGLLVLVSLTIPGRTQVHLGFRPDGAPGDLVPAARLLLLPVLDGLVILTDFFLGLFYFRRQESQHLSYLLWGSGTVVAFLFLVGTYFILRAG